MSYYQNGHRVICINYLAILHKLHFANKIFTVALSVLAYF